MATIKVFGPPGTGKTTYLLNTVERELERGIFSSQIGYFAFTRKASTEAKERALIKFPHLEEKTDFPWFRTLHSLAYRSLGIGTKDMMAPENYREFAKLAKLDMSVEETGEEEGFVRADNPILNEINLARIRGVDLRTHYNRSSLKIEWFHFEFVERTYRQYKNTRNLLDFTDLLEKVLLEPDRLPSLETVIIDEAQDLSRLQWDIVKELVARSTTSYIAGDDDQAIYRWAGADVDTFLELPGETVVLDKSYRVPPRIHTLADSVSNRIRRRQSKFWSPKEGEEGNIFVYDRFDQVNIRDGDDWLVIAATNYFLTPMHAWLLSEGIMFERNGNRSVSEAVMTAVLGWESLRKGKEVPFNVVSQVYKHLGSEYISRGHKTLKTADPEESFTLDKLKNHHGLLTDVIWHEALTKIAEDKRDYIVALLRRGVKLTGKPPVRLSTIHAVKGGEAEKVLLRLDLSSRFMNEYDNNPDDMHRLLYVGITRAKKELHLIRPENNYRGFKL